MARYYRYLIKPFLFFQLTLLAVMTFQSADAADKNTQDNHAKMWVAGGCFWCWPRFWRAG